MTKSCVNVILNVIILTNILSVIQPFEWTNRNKNIQYWWGDGGKYGSGLNLLKNTLSIRNSCNSNNDDFEEMAREK
jgi:hypothetical protein